VTPTEAGSALLERARQILGDLDEARTPSEAVDSPPRHIAYRDVGIVRNPRSHPTSAGVLGAPYTASIDLVISDRNEDLVAEGVDIAYDSSLADSGFGVRLLGRAPRLVWRRRLTWRVEALRTPLPSYRATIASWVLVSRVEAGGAFAQAGALTSFPSRVGYRRDWRRWRSHARKQGSELRWLPDGCAGPSSMPATGPILSDYQLESSSFTLFIGRGERPSSRSHGSPTFLPPAHS